MIKSGLVTRRQRQDLLMHTYRRPPEWISHFLKRLNLGELGSVSLRSSQDLLKYRLLFGESLFWPDRLSVLVLFITIANTNLFLRVRLFAVRVLRRAFVLLRLRFFRDDFQRSSDRMSLFHRLFLGDGLERFFESLSFMHKVFRLVGILFAIVRLR